jgi:AAA domain
MIGAVANGIPWLGHEVNQSGRAALILGEGGFDLGERLSSWLYGNPGATDDRMLFSVEEGLDLTDQQRVDQIIEERLDFADDWKLIIFDTQADHMPSGDEDNARTSR